MDVILFLVFAAIAVVCAINVVVQTHPISSALSLVGVMGSLAVLYLLLGAEFIAAAQVIVYAGAIMVLFVFAIMVLIPGKEETGEDPRRPYRLLGLPVGAALFLELIVIVSRHLPASGGPPVAGSADTIGRILFTQYLFPFELTSVLLLAAMVGVLLLARRRA